MPKYVAISELRATGVRASRGVGAWPSPSPESCRCEQAVAAAAVRLPGTRFFGVEVLAAGVLAAAHGSRRRRRHRRQHLRVRLLAQLTATDGWDDEEVQVESEPAMLSKRAPLLIEGEIILTEETFRVYSPATGNLVGLAPRASCEQLERAVEAADRASGRWAALRHSQRAAYLRNCATLLRENLESLATLQTNESGRPIHETRLELIVAAANFEASARLLNIEREEEVSSDGDKRVVLRRTPIGVVAVIAPWNAPIVLGWKPTSSALACGNTVVLKPAPQTPLTSLRIGELFRGVLPPGVLNVVVGSDRSEPRPGEVLTSHPMVRKVVFTGSAAIGSKVMEACAKDFKRILLELGGNDAAIIRHDVDIESAAEGVFQGAFFNNGQTCCAIKRIFAHHSIFDDFVEALAARARRARLGNGLTAGTELGPLASYVQLRHITELVEDAKKFGGRVICGGGAIAGPPGDQGTNTGLFYLPTVVVGVREGTRLVDEEQFGPVVPVMPFKDDAEAIRRANGTDYGLGASVWSADIAKANELANKLRAGTVWVNRHCEFIRNAPFGGIGSSGIGRAGDLGLRDMAEYTELRTMVLAPLPVPEVAPAVPMPRVEVQEQARELLRQRLAAVRVGLREDPDAFEEAAREAVRTFPLQPVNFKTALQSLCEADGPACVLVQGLPTELSRGPRSSELAGETILVGVAGVLGARAFTYKGFGDALIQDPLTVSDEAFGWHRIGRCSPPRDAPRRIFREEEYVAEFVAVFCQQADESTSVSYVDFRKLCAAISLEDLTCLRGSQLSFFDSEKGYRSEQVSVVTDLGPAPLPPLLDVQGLERFEPEGPDDVVAAYQRVCQAAERVAESVRLRAGDLVVFNNKRCLHRWAPSGVDGQSRLQMVCASSDALGWPSRIVQ